MHEKLLLDLLKLIAGRKDTHGITLPDLLREVGGEFTVEEIASAIIDIKQRRFAEIETSGVGNDTYSFHGLTAAGKFYLHRALRNGEK